MRATVGALAALLCVLIFSSMTWAQAVDHITVDFDDITFDVPAQGWQKAWDGRAPGREVPQVEFTHKLGEGRAQSVGVWPVIFPPSLQGRTQQEHASAIFTIERVTARPADQRWEFGAEEEREIGGRQFPTMSFRVTIARARTVADGVFILYFPDDYDARRKFYVVMWDDIHPNNEPGTGPDVLNTIIASLKVKP